MARIRKVEIENFRGIRHLAWDPAPGINCLIGPGDSGKSTVLDAIDLCLGARRTVQFADSDFYGLDTARPISITLTLGGLSDALCALDGYGQFLRGRDPATGAITDEPGYGTEVVLSLNLTVAGDLEPVWSLYSNRAAQQGLQRNLQWKDRVGLAPVRIGASADYHLGWQRGSVLNRVSDERLDASQALVAAARQARNSFGAQAEVQLQHTLQLVADTARTLGVRVGDRPQALLDAHAVSFGAGTIALHDSAGIPLRGLGTGSTRLMIAGLQQQSGAAASVVLVDELEYGLEPHRIARFLHALGSKQATWPVQAFLTTHSPVALRELSGAQLFVMRPTADGHEVRCVGQDQDAQSTIRLYPEAFLAPSVIVCEGATEVGFLRGLDLDRATRGLPSLAAQGVALVDCGGGPPERPYQRASAFAALGYRVMILRDGDVPPDPNVERAFLEAGHAVVAWDPGHALEDQLFAHLPAAACWALVLFAHSLHGDVVRAHIQSASNGGAITLDSIYAELSNTSLLSAPVRAALGRASRAQRAGWFKSISWMEEAAQTIVAPSLATAPPYLVQRIDSIFTWAAHAAA